MEDARKRQYTVNYSSRITCADEAQLLQGNDELSNQAQINRLIASLLDFFKLIRETNAK
jgi:hypothetical protein